MPPRAVIILIIILAAILVLAAVYAARHGHLTSKGSRIAVILIVVIAGAVAMLYPYLGLQTPSPSL